MKKQSIRKFRMTPSGDVEWTAWREGQTYIALDETLPAAEKFRILDLAERVLRMPEDFQFLRRGRQGQAYRMGELVAKVSRQSVVETAKLLHPFKTALLDAAANLTVAEALNSGVEVNGRVLCGVDHLACLSMGRSVLQILPYVEGENLWDKFRDDCGDVENLSKGAECQVRSALERVGVPSHTVDVDTNPSNLIELEDMLFAIDQRAGIDFGQLMNLE